MKIFRTPFLIAVLFLSVAPLRAALEVKLFEPKTTGSKAVIKLELKNTFTEKIESARAVCFVSDEQGKVVGQSAKWVIGGAKDRPALSAGATNAFYFVIAADKPFTTTNLTAKVSFNRVILAGGKLADVSKDVTVTPVTK